jgi:mono/diheme cytochrome c family protein
MRFVSRALAAAVMIIAIGALAGGAGAQQGGADTKSPIADPYSRALQTYQFKKAAASGPERGREIFYYKCWFCHNEYTKNAPQLTGLFKRETLLSGLPVNTETVKDRVRNGGEGMAAYKYTLSEADIDDLVSFVREECCWNSDAPPLNPAYKPQ